MNPHGSDAPRESSAFTRRQMLQSAGKLMMFAPLLGVTTGFSCDGHKPAAKSLPRRSDDALLEEIKRASFRFFWEETDHATGQVKDRALADGGDSRTVSSIAATGFGLTALCIADERKYESSSAIRERVRNTLKFLVDGTPNVHGYYYHFIDMTTGKRQWECELSSIDTALLFCGVLTARAHYKKRDQEIVDLATKLYERVEWGWFLNGSSTLHMGWYPERGFGKAKWDHFCELMMLYLLAIGSPTHPLPRETWHAFRRDWLDYEGFRYITTSAPLFIHQYSQAWFDFRNLQDDYTDYFENSVIATRAHKQFCLSLRDRYPLYSEHLWGITASDSATGYQAWGGPPQRGRLDGSIVPCAAGGSIPFRKDECMDVLHTIREQYGNSVWKKYSYVDAFNPHNGWVNKDVIGIDLGITMVMAENTQTGFVWETFMKNVEMQNAMKAVGFRARKA